MTQRERIPDASKAGRSSVVPYKVGEGARRRHYRRLHANLGYETAVQKWCAEHGFAMRITNEGHHWQLRKGQFVAEWWPSSAKLVLNKAWQRGIHCHDYKQALRAIADAYERQAENKTRRP